MLFPSRVALYFSIPHDFKILQINTNHDHLWNWFDTCSGVLEQKIQSCSSWNSFIYLSNKEIVWFRPLHYDSRARFCPLHNDSTQHIRCAKIRTIFTLPWHLTQLASWTRQIVQKLTALTELSNRKALNSCYTMLT